MPERLKNKNIKDVRIHPKYSAPWFEIEYVCEDEKIATLVNPDKAIAINLGVDNLCACIDTEGHQFLIDRKGFKSINRCYNKQNAYLQQWWAGIGGLQQTTINCGKPNIKPEGSVNYKP